MWLSVNLSRRIKNYFNYLIFSAKPDLLTNFKSRFHGYFIIWNFSVFSKIHPLHTLPPPGKRVTHCDDYHLYYYLSFNKEDKKQCNNHIRPSYWKFYLRMVRFSSSEFAVTTWKSFVFSKLLLIIISKVLFCIPWKFFI